MTEKELRKLSRSELLQMLITQMEENKGLNEQLQVLQEQQKERKIMMNDTGSIAEAALKVNGVFEAAQAAAQQYLENIQRVSEEQDAVCRELTAEAQTKADTIIDDAQKTAETLVTEARTKATTLVDEAQTKATAMMEEAKQYHETAHSEADAYWEQVFQKAKAILEDQDSLRALVQSAKR